jgi:alpha-amylase/alpha-mannosidase (GH57 family)
MRRRPVLALLALAVLAAACTPSSEPSTTSASAQASTTVAETDPGFYLMLMWHQHQPFYPKDGDGVYTRPWVRVHATKDYYDMASTLERFPSVTATFNLTPVLLLQLEDLARGAKDAYWTAAEIPADRLTAGDRRFLLERFFDVNPKIVARFPRYQELADDRAAEGVDGALASWTDQDFRDLQVLFNLGWTDPDFLATEPLAGLVARGRDFTEADKEALFAEHRRIISEVIPLHSRLWEEGRIEVTTTPLAHPILPLISDTALAAVGDPAALLPETRFQQIQDADAQVVRGLDVAERLLGRRPSGMWPGEGSVAQMVMGLFSKNGVRWVATGEDVLAKSLDIGSFTRDATDTVSQPDLLYRPWAAQLSRNPNVAMFFRDVRISDQIGFEYSGTSGAAAADDFMARLRNIRDALDARGLLGGDRPPVVSVILDGENAWENYENDGKDFLEALYGSLSEADWVQTITPSQYLDRFAAPEPLEEVFPAAWFQPNFATWIGEPEEATAWDYLYRVRRDLERARGEAGYDAAFEAMLFAEGSDWFWWYGSDQDSGNDAYFDAAYRELLGGVYDSLGQERPAFLSVPIIPETPVAADAAPADLLTVAIDGDAADWEGAGSYGFDGVEVRWAFDRQNLYLRVEGAGEGLLYLGAPEGEKVALANDETPLGFGATHVVLFGDDCGVGPARSEPEPVACRPTGEGVEIAVPLTVFGALEPGDTILAKLEADGARLPATGPMAFQVPDISNVEVLLDVADPVGDDHGPGTYTYPTDGVFAAGSYDLTRFQVGTEGDDVVLTFEVVAAIQNPWGSPRGLSVQTFDVYVDTDPGAGTGARLLIPGRNAALADDNGWEYAVTIEGWDPAIYVAAPDGTWEETTPSFDVITFGDKGKVVARIPRSLFGDGDLLTWGWAAAVMSQEGFPSSGVRRIRDVEAAAQQWRLGGSPGGINATRILDVAWPTAGEQESLLSGYEVVAAGKVDDLGPEQFGTIPLLVAG